MAHDYEDALDYSSRWLDLIHKTEFPTVEEAHRIIDESKYNFAEFYNRNWLEYRKSVTEAGDWAAVEWTGSGALFKDVLGENAGAAPAVEESGVEAGVGLLQDKFNCVIIQGSHRFNVIYKEAVSVESLICHEALDGINHIGSGERRTI